MAGFYRIYTTVKSHQMSFLIDDGFRVTDMGSIFEGSKEKHRNGLNYIPSSVIHGTERETAKSILGKLDNHGLWATMVDPDGEIIEDNSPHPDEVYKNG